ncbi:MAG: hypothetical protein R3C56_16850 [Pirellulaceae bacterium]
MNAPSCTPYRSSLVSGQYFWGTGRGAILQGAVWDMDIPTGRCCCDSGYHLGKLQSLGARNPQGDTYW